MKKQLTPIYVIRFNVKNVTGNNTFHLSYRLTDSQWEKYLKNCDDRFPERIQVKTFNKKEAIKVAKQLNSSLKYDTGTIQLGIVDRDQIYNIVVSHYGFKERGFLTEVKEKDIVVAY